MEESRHGIVGQARSPAAASIAGASSHQEGGRAWERVLSEAEVDSLEGGCSEAARSLARREPPIPDVAKQALQLQAGGGLGDTVDSNVLKHTTKSHWFVTFPFTLDAD